MALDRTIAPFTDDSGLGVDGTPINAAWWTAAQNMIDSRWRVEFYSNTGTVNNLTLTPSGIEADVLVIGNASDLTITGFAAPASPAKSGKGLYVFAVGAGNIYFVHNSGSSSAGNKIATLSPFVNMPIAGTTGAAAFRYDGNTGIWRMVSHDQGRPISYTPTITPVAGAFTTVTATGKHMLRGGRCSVNISVTITTVGTAATAWSATLPYTVATHSVGPVVERSATGIAGMGQFTAGGSAVLVRKYDATFLGANGYVVEVAGDYEV